MTNIFRRLLIVTALVAGVAPLLASCSGEKKDPLTVDRPAEQIYKEAEAAEQDGKYKDAITLYSELERQHPYSDYATEAQIRQAQAAYGNMKYTEAIIALDRFIELHPGHPKVDYAYYLKALCFYEQMTDIRRDQSMSQASLEALEVVINRFPDSKYARDAKLKRDLVRDHLAGKEMEIGRYYQKRGELNAAINRYLNVVKTYDTTNHIPEALHRLVECYMTLGIKDEATRVAAVLGYNYPGSQWYSDSYDLLDPAQRARIKDERSWIDRKLSSLLKPD